MFDTEMMRLQFCLTHTVIMCLDVRSSGCWSLICMIRVSLWDECRKCVVVEAFSHRGMSSRTWKHLERSTNAWLLETGHGTEIQLWQL